LFPLAAPGALAAPAWQPGQGCRWAAVSVPASGKTGFTLLPPEMTGVAFTNHLADETSAQNRVLENGSGVALGDVDGDGWCDIYFCRLEGDNVLYRNLGNWKFEDLTQAAGVACPDQYSTGAAFADLDGDGDLDLLVNAIGGGTRSFLNDGQGHFTEIADTRLTRRFGATSLALADIDGDGDLDLYVTNYRTTTYKDRPPGLKVEAKMEDGRIVVTPEDRFIPLMPRAGGVEVLELGERDFLYVNDGQGRFAPVSWTTGSFLDPEAKPLPAPPLDWGLSVMFRDLNGDLAPDIYVCNDLFYFPDRVWVNENSQRFRAIPRLALRNMTLSSMGVDFADINRDGYDDFIVTDMVSRNHQWRHRQRPNMMKGIVTQALENAETRPEVARNTLCVNRGDGTYAEIAQLSGVDFTEWSWGAVFLDADLDGYEDLLIPTGNDRDVQDADVLRALAMAGAPPKTLEDRVRAWRQYPALATPVLAYRNNHDLTFTEIGGEWGFTASGPFQGMALADLDNDGDLDVVISRLNKSAALYRNETIAPRLGVRLKGLAPNTRGIGARIEVVGGPVKQCQEMLCGGRYVSCDDTLRVFAVGPGAPELTIQVTWRGGGRSVVEKALPNRIYEVDEAAAGVAAAPPKPDRPSWFADVSERLQHVHRDEPFDDYARQPLLSRRLSRSGPGVAWVDVDGNGWDDLAIGGGGGSSTALFLNDGRGNLVAATNAASTQPAERDATGIVGLVSRSGKAVLVWGLANYEDGAAAGACVRAYDPEAGQVKDVVPAGKGSVGPLAVADVDGDGDLDLFVGGRVAAGRYPEPTESLLLRHQDGQFVLAQKWEKLGLVSGAVWSDLDADGWPDLVLACEWGPVRVFRNEQGKLTETTRQLGLEPYTGWWNGVATGDFDSDGQMDIVAANWGRNTRFQRHLARPLRIYYGDLSGGEGVDVLETYYEPSLQKWTPWRDFETVAKVFPAILERLPTFKAYGNAGVEEVLGDSFAKAKWLEASTLDSMLFLNRGRRFEAKPLPLEAQFAPAFGVVVADFNGDGHQDVFLSQNFFSVEPETSRYDAGRGQLLVGDGKGNLAPVAGQESGLTIYGEQRGCAACDYDGDGRVDLVVAQNHENTRLFHNTLAKPGLRVRLAGPSANPGAVGAVVRLVVGGRPGAAHEIHGGSGYWSQDSAGLVLARPAEPAQLMVRWPGGRTTAAGAPQSAREVELKPDGSLRVLR
jgi:hypothetical protein